MEKFLGPEKPQTSDTPMNDATPRPLDLLAAGLLLFALALGAIFPSAAYPEFVAATGALIFAAGLLSAFRWLAGGGGSLPASRLIPIIVILLLAMLGNGPVEALGLNARGTMVLAGLTLLAGYWAIRSGAIPPLRLVGILAVGLGVSSLYGIWQSLGPAWGPGTFASFAARFEPGSRPEELDERLLAMLQEGRASGTLGAPNIYAALCLAGIALAGGLGAGRLPVRSGWLWMTAAGAGVLALFLTGSRGGLLAFLVAIVAGGSAFTLWRGGAIRAARIALIGLTALFVVAGAIVALSLSGALGNVGRFTPSGIVFRFQYWATAVEIIRDQGPWLTGTPGAFAALYGRFRLAGADETIHPHQSILELIFAVGLLATLLLLALGGLLFWRTLQRLSQFREQGDRMQFSLTTGVAVAVLAIAAQSLVEYTVSFRETALLLALLIGALAALVAPPVPPAATPWRFAWILPLAAAVFVGWTSVFEASANELRRAEIMFVARDERDLLRALNLADGLVALQPSDFRHWQIRATLRHELGRGNWRSDNERARELNPFSAELLEFAALREAALGQLENAITLQRQAIANHPLALRHRLVLIELLLQADDKEAARTEIATARALRARSGGELDRLGNFLRRLEVD